MATRLQIIRGNTIGFSTTFYDRNGNVVSPPSASLTIEYPDGAGGYTSTVIAMTQNVNVWSASWATKSITPGRVFWRAFASDGTNDVANQGDFDLIANTANTAL